MVAYCNGYNGGAVSLPSINGTSMTALASVPQTDGCAYGSLWGLINPSVGGTVPISVAVTNTYSEGLVWEFAYFSGVDTASPIRDSDGTYGVSGAIDRTLDCIVGDYAFIGAGGDSMPVPQPANVTEIASQDVLIQFGAMAGDLVASGTSITLGLRDSAYTSFCACTIKATSSGPGNYTPPANNAVNFILKAYSLPANDAVDFDFSTGIICAGIASAESFGQPTVSVQISAAGIVSGESFGQPTVSTGTAAHDITGAGSITGLEALGSPTARATILSAGIASGESFGQPIVSVRISAAGIASGESSGVPIIGAGIAAAGIASGESFGVPIIGAAISAAGIASGESFGGAIIYTVVSMAGIVSAEDAGDPTIEVKIFPEGIISGETFGLPKVGEIAPAFITGAGDIISDELFGLPDVWKMPGFADIQIKADIFSIDIQSNFFVLEYEASTYIMDAQGSKFETDIENSVFNLTMEGE